MPWLLNTAVIDQGEQLNPRFPMLILCCVARASCLLVLLLFFEFIPVQENCPFAFYFVQCSFPARYDCLSKVWIPVWLNAYSLLVFHLAAVQIVLCYWLGFFLTHTSSHLRGLPDMVFYPPPVVVCLKEDVWPRISLCHPSEMLPYFVLFWDPSVPALSSFYTASIWWCSFLVIVCRNWDWFTEL